MQALNLREEYNERRRRYYECKNVEKALQCHIQDAIEDKYLEALINEDTQLIQEDIPDVLTHLFNTYGKVQTEEVKQQESDIRSMTFHPADPLITLFNPIERLKKLGEAANIPYSEAQFLDIGLTVIRNTRDFERALGDWELLLHANKTWETFKTHFKAAQKQLKAIRGPTMQQAGYHHASHLANQLRQDFDSRNDEILSILQTAMEQHNPAPTSSNTTVSALTTPNQQINATTSNGQMGEILQILKQLQTALVTTPTQPTPTRKRQPRKTPDNATFPRKTTDKYCWTHGGCGHISSGCQSKAPGHQDDATFQNRMGGFNAYCPPSQG